MRYKIQTICAILLLASGVSQAQKKTLTNPNEKFENLAYIDAQKLYLDIAAKGYESSELFARLGDTYYFNNDYSKANEWYGKLFSKFSGAGLSKEHYFRYAQSLKAIGDYDKAQMVMTQYDALASNDIGNMHVKEPNYLELIEMNSGRYDIVNDEINTANQDFGTSYYRGTGQVVFASSKDTSSMVNRRHRWNDRVFLDLFIADADPSSGALSNPRSLGKQINTKFHESNAVYTKNGNTMYFTRNNFYQGQYRKASDEINKLKIYRATRNSDKEKWDNIEELSINSDEYSTAHPALNASEDKLYFASDRPGSKTGPNGERLSDIWMVSISKDGTLGQPVNLESINTAGNELFPFVSDNGDLYFSSTGQLGLGGLDVFTSLLDKNGVPSKPTNLGKPLNGPYDDFAFVMDDRNKAGYFSSNRPEGKGLDDIYRFKETKPIQCKVFVTGVVKDEKTGEILPGSVVSIFDKDNKQVATITTGADASYKALLDCDQRYSVRAVKDGYDQVESVVQTPKVSGTVQVPMELKTSMDDNINNVQVGDDLAKVLNIPIIYFDFDKSNIRPDAEVELQKVLAFMNERPTSVIDIRSHTDCRAPDLYNLKLSDRRAKSTRQYLISKGIAPSRLTAKGYGEFQLVNECADGVPCSEEKHQLNRRSEFIVVKL